ncbi:MAG: head decoration protein [Pikeienuella sp.]|uniref:head decoration protein n=1 Tax=Pikeienuella sp. TaxID=2831957 RepID=UPI00391BD5BF
MTTLSEPNYTGDVVLWEEDAFYSRDEAIIISGQNVKIGAVLGQITASGKWTLSAPGASDGSQAPKGVLVHADVDATGGDAAGVILVREARVRRAGLIFHSTIDDATKRNTAVAALKAVGIIAS